MRLNDMAAEAPTTLGSVTQARSLARGMMLGADGLFPMVQDPAQRLRLEQRVLTLIMDGLRTTLITAVVGPALVAWLILPTVGSAAALAPALLLYALTVERLFCIRRVARARARDDNQPRRWLNAVTWRTALSSAIVAGWGYPVIVSGNDTLLFVILALATLVAASSVTQFCCWPPAMWASFTPMLLGLSAQVLLFGSGERLFGAFFLALLWLTLGMAGLRFARTLHNDMTTRLLNEQLMRELDQRRAQAEAANAAKSRFFAAASHDLRQPLQALSLYHGVLEGSARDAPTLGRMGECMASLDRLLEVVMDLSRLDAGQITPTPRPFAVQPLLERLAGMYHGVARQKGLALRVHPTAAWARSDLALLERALSNLVANSIRYTERGGVLLGARPHGDAWRLCVVDTGIGIPGHAHEAVFEEFVQLDNAARDPTKGSGLGLATVRRVATLLGHRVSLKSRAGRGSVFALDVPRTDPLPRSLPASAPAANPPRSLHGRVLVVDDNPNVRDALVQLMRKWGLHVDAAADADEASHAMVRQTYDAVVSDWRLPGERDGLAVLHEARQRLPGLRLALLVTGEDLQQLHQAGSTFHVLRKPVKPLRLRALLAARLGLSPAAAPACAVEVGRESDP